MAEIETLGILEEIQSLISDKLQVVSYKWLSRNFLVSSNDAKRLLHDFVENHGNGIEVVYTLSGWLKNDPSIYHIRLVSKPKLAEAKQEYDENCSVQIYSVQACLPKDPAVLWNAEFVQAEELYKQSQSVDNCLLDNRFCGVSNSFVKRNAEGAKGTTTMQPVRTTGTSGSSRYTLANQSTTVPQLQQKRVQGSSPNKTLQSPDVVKDVKNESNLPENKVKVPQLAANAKKVQTDKNSSGTGGALANMWGRASAKPKPECASVEANSISNSSDAQICAHEELEHESSDEEGQGVNIKRSCNGEAGRKRRVVFDYSDEEDEYKDAVSLESPDPPKKQSILDAKQSSHFSDSENKLNFEEDEEDKPKLKDRKGAGKKIKEESLALSKGNTTKPRVETVETVMKDKTMDAAPKSPKRRKVLKTRMDERGREVTEVVWEGEELETKPDSDTMKKIDSIPASNTFNRSAAVKKSPAVAANATSNQIGKAGNKKSGNKDPKQGNIMSFFKRV